MAVGGFDEEELEDLERNPELQACAAGQTDEGVTEVAQKGSVRTRMERTRARLVWESNMPRRMVDSRTRLESKKVVVTVTEEEEEEERRRRKKKEERSRKKK